MKKLFGVLALLASTTAYSADLAVKAPVMGRACAPYIGINAMGAGAGINSTPGVAPFGAVAIQGDIGLTGGYFCQMAPGSRIAFWFVEGMFDWTNLNGASAGFSLTGPAHFEQRIGVAAGALGDYLPSFFGISVPSSTGLLPQGATAGSPQLYAFGALHEQDISLNFGDVSRSDWAFYPGVGLGTLTVVTASDGSKTTWDTFAEATMQQSSVCIGGRGCGNLGVGGRVGIQIKN